MKFWGRISLFLLVVVVTSQFLMQVFSGTGMNNLDKVDESQVAFNSTEPCNDTSVDVVKVEKTLHTRLSGHYRSNPYPKT